MSERLMVCASPHLRDRSSTSRIMRDVIIALMPALIAGVLVFGIQALVVVVVTTGAAVLTDWLVRKALKKEHTIGDYSAVVTGLLLGLNLTPSIPLWIAVVGSFLAIGVIKELFGGLGQNFMNPALGARAILLVSYGQAMTAWVNPTGVDAVTAATPMGILKEGGVLPNYMDMFLGRIGGCIGETSAVAILLGFAYLLIRKVISWEIPVIMTGTTVLLGWILGKEGFFTGDPIVHLLGGGLLLGAVFMATDYATSPLSKKGIVIYAFGIGLLTILFRLYTSMPEGVSFAIILMNIATPLIDRYTVPKSFGGVQHV